MEARWRKLNSQNPGGLVIENKWRYFWNRSKREAGNRVLYFHGKKKKNYKFKANAVLIKVEKDGEIKLALAKWIPDEPIAKEHGEEQEDRTFWLFLLDCNVPGYVQGDFFFNWSPPQNHSFLSPQKNLVFFRAK